jgi:hypothetical protein
MTHIKEILKHFKVYFSEAHPSPATDGGAIEQNLNSSTIHRVIKPAKSCTDSIIAQFTQSTQANRGLNTGIFAAIGGVV